MIIFYHLNLNTRLIWLKLKLVADGHNLLTPHSVEKIRGDPSIGWKGLRQFSQSVERIDANPSIRKISELVGANQGIDTTT